MNVIDFKNSYDRYFIGNIAPLKVSREAFDEIVERAREQAGGSLVGCSTEELWNNGAGVYVKGTADFSTIDCRFASTFPKVDVSIPLNEEEQESLKIALKGNEKEGREKVRSYDYER